MWGVEPGFKTEVDDALTVQQIHGWEMTAVGEPLREAVRDVASIADDDVLVEIAGCGVCHTDLGFLYDGVPTRHPLPLILGHEISGTVVETGANAARWNGRKVIVPAVMPCGRCDVCRRGRGSICPKQIFPGNDLDGGFATHVVVPAQGLCEVPSNGSDVALADLSVVADAITTPYQAIVRSGLGEGDLAIFVGIGGVGGFGVQIANALGATVIAIDVDAKRLALSADHGAALTIDAQEHDARAIKKMVREYAKSNALPRVEWKIFETSGTPAGQQTAFSLLCHGAYLSVVGFTPKRVEVPVSHLMAFDARAEGCWGCLPELYPAALDLVLAGEVQLGPFVQRRSLASINETFEELRAHAIRERVVLLPGTNGSR